MPLSFYTKPQQMTFVDSVTGHVTDAWSLQPFHNYEVYFVIQNDEDTEAKNVQIKVTHSAFGIGLPPGDSLIAQPAPVNVPPKGPGGNGLATVKFGFLAPAGGHGCLAAQIQPNGPILNQNLTIIGINTGVPSVLSFLVYGSTAPEKMVLKLVEKHENGSPVTQGQSWPHSLEIPGALNPQVTPDGAVISLPANTYYSIGLKVTAPPAATETRIFNVSGYVNNAYVGEVDLRVVPNTTPVPVPDPYVYGGYNSFDIILYDHLGHEIPIGGEQNLLPNTNYGFAVRVHNSSPTPAVNTVVRFWEHIGGLAIVGIPIGVQTVTVPGNGFVVVHSPQPFRSAPPNQHNCAVVSIYNAASKTCPDAATSDKIPNPSLPNGTPNSHSCSAWRNTHSRMWPIISKKWNIQLQVDRPIRGPIPEELQVIAFHVDQAWREQSQVRTITDALSQVQVGTMPPAYLIPSVYKTMKPVDANVEVRTANKEIVSAAKTPINKLEYHAREGLIHKVFGLKEIKGTDKVPLDISGTLPKDVKPGDDVVLKFIAHYAKTEAGPARAVEFTEILHVVEKE